MRIIQLFITYPKGAAPTHLWNGGKIAPLSIIHNSDCPAFKGVWGLTTSMGFVKSCGTRSSMIRLAKVLSARNPMIGRIEFQEAQP